MTPTDPTDGGEDGESDSEPVQQDFHEFRTWIDWIIGDELGIEMLLRALLFSSAVFGLGLLVAVVAGDGAAYLRSTSAYLVGLGILLATASYGWGSWKFLAVLDESRAAFDVKEETYTNLVSKGLATIYTDSAILLEFAIALVAILALEYVVPIPVAIRVAQAPIVEVLGTTIQYADVIQHVLGIIVLLFVVTGIHMVSRAMGLLYRISQLPLVAPQTAAIELDDLADFSEIVATMWFLVVVLMVAVYLPLIRGGGAQEAGFEMEPWVIGTAVGLLLVGVAIFLVPQVILHSALVRRKRDRLVELDAQLDTLLSDLRNGTRDPDSISLALEIYDRQRERVNTTRTWLLDSRRLLRLVSSAIAATVSVLAQIPDLPWIGG